MSRVAALAAVFGVAPSYLVDRGTDPLVLDKETLAALSDETAAAILRESARLPVREREIVLGIIKAIRGGTLGPTDRYEKHNGIVSIHRWRVRVRPR